jgi:uncharacterized membrane protein
VNGPSPPALAARSTALHRFALTAAVFALCYAASYPFMSWDSQLIASWDASALFYLALAWKRIVKSDARSTREHAEPEDSSRFVMLLVFLFCACASLVAIGYVVSGIDELAFWPRAGHLALSIGALVFSWLVIQTVFTFHYAHLYYWTRADGAHARAPLEFPGHEEPDYRDFAYYAFVVGMTTQVSDVTVTTKPLRWFTLVHAVFAFMFNMAVLALALNIIASVVRP